ncbi:hyperosmotically inducible protein [Chryseobacterium sp. SORGH_AS 447]|uniref:BON domain-containing protein n=1 Tax=Chryseobacterium sp. SORGH_AS_0447 TaxID=3041769 RepID=UPI0027896BBB|nr:BON domain-containing protein [Chryseobacterium sp. SORGH_AS_0447]MDQ1161077.1 hyperosmotically inducible protein [Chryseobacterium sp. SORGH_AS_0447]
MKKSIAMAALAIAVSFGSVSCKKKVSDADLQTQATTVVVSNPNASVEVKDGVAHLSGTFETQEAKDAMIKQLKAINGVKEVMDMATVAPSATAAPAIETQSAVAPEVQQKVQDAVKDIPGVKVEVVNGELTLTGNISSSDARKVKESVDALKVGKVNYNYTVTK